mmetsp:Transcript_4074/g.10366  ORF Transcript_4074/g.10366 Transcript_4074/m.10366 type:complete len:261 (-) Transcript_4074:1123-1905(-)
MSKALRWGTSSSSLAGTAVSNLLPSSGCSPTSPPRKICTPSTPIVLPVSSLTFLAGAPISPMSPTCACPHELGQPVQCTRTSFGIISIASRRSAMRTARCLVSTRPWPQNSEPVQETMPRMIDMSCSTRSLAPLFSAGSASSSSRRALSTLGRITFCSTVSRISLPEYFSARSAIWRISAQLMRPTGTVTPTHDLPACFCACTPRMSRRWYVPVGLGAATSSGATPRLARPALTISRNQGRPLSSSSHISRVFCRSPREP